MTADQTPDVPQDAEEPPRTVEDALRELQALYRVRVAQQRAARRKGSDARLLERLQQQSVRRRRPEETGQ